MIEVEIEMSNEEVSKHKIDKLQKLLDDASSAGLSQKNALVLLAKKLVCRSKVSIRLAAMFSR